MKFKKILFIFLIEKSFYSLEEFMTMDSQIVTCEWIRKNYVLMYLVVICVGLWCFVCWIMKIDAWCILVIIFCVGLVFDVSNLATRGICCVSLVFSYSVLVYISGIVNFITCLLCNPILCFTSPSSFLYWSSGRNTITILYYTILYYAILYYTTLYYTNTMLCYTILYYIILYYTMLYYTILHYTVLYYAMLHYTTL